MPPYHFSFVSPLYTQCASKCFNMAAFTCRSFSYAASWGFCVLSDHNVALTGAIVADGRFDYYESIAHGSKYTCPLGSF